MSTIFDEFVSSATIHGVSHTADKHNTKRKYLWIALMVLMAASLIAFITQEFMEYRKFSSATNIKVTYLDQIQLPTVTICNLNMVKKGVRDCIPGVNMTKLFYELSETSTLTQTVFTKDAFSGVISDIPSGEDILKCIHTYAHELDVMLPFCVIKEKLVKCSDVFKPKVTEYGICYTFNGDSDSQQFADIPGPEGGLRVFVNIEQEEYFYSKSIQAGIKVVLHGPNDEPVPSWGGFLVAPGLSAQTVISRRKSRALPHPYGECLDTQADRYVNPLKRFKSYGIMSCRRECFIDFMFSVCGCRHFLDQGSDRLCDYNELLECYSKHIQNVTIYGAYTNSCKCPATCNEVTYDTSVSYGSFCSDFVSAHLHNLSLLPSVDYTDRNFIDLRIFFGSLMEVDVTEIPAKTIPDIFGNLGGHMGLFLGASMLSIVELVEFCILLVTSRSRRVNQQDQIPESQVDDESVGDMSIVLEKL